MAEDNYTRFLIQSVNVNKPIDARIKTNTGTGFIKKYTSTRTLKNVKTKLLTPKNKVEIIDFNFRDKPKIDLFIEDMREEKNRIRRQDNVRKFKERFTRQYKLRFKKDSQQHKIIKGFMGSNQDIDFNPIQVPVNTKLKTKLKTNLTINHRLNQIKQENIKTDISQHFPIEDTAKLKSFIQFNSKKKICNLRTTTLMDKENSFSINKYKEEKEKQLKINEAQLFENKENSDIKQNPRKSRFYVKKTELPKIKSSLMKVKSFNKNASIKVFDKSLRLEKMLNSPSNMKFKTIKKAPSKQELSGLLSKHDKYNLHYLKNTYFQF